MSSYVYDEIKQLLLQSLCPRPAKMRMVSMTPTMTSNLFHLCRICHVQWWFGDHLLGQTFQTIQRQQKFSISTHAKILGRTTVYNGAKSDVGLTTVQMIKNHGYSCETHYITTEDGYILTYHRIPSIPSSKKPSVLIMHGLLSSSADFVNNGNKSLAFVLSKEGYDVWLANARGNSWSRNHMTLDVNKNPKAFFNFSWHEIGYYDLASAIDYILKLKNEKSLFYVGHSQGTTAFMVLTSTRPEYNKKIEIAHLLAPAGLMTHCPSQILFFLSKYVGQIEKMLMQREIYEIPYTECIKKGISRICTHEQLCFICNVLFRLVPLESLKTMDKNLLRVITTNFPSNSATKQIIHYAQLIKSGRFAHYDYGLDNNVKIYGSKQPPIYDFNKITAAVALYYSNTDGLISVKDAKLMVNQLPNVILDYLVPRSSFDHIDFLFASDVVTLVYDKLLTTSELKNM